MNRVNYHQNLFPFIINLPNNMKYLIYVLCMLALSGCQTIPALPALPAFPELPPGLQEPCAKLEKINIKTPTLSDTLMVVTNNYSRYHECSNKVDTLLEWHRTQKKISESLK